MSSVWTRDYLRKKGIANQDIGWNPQSGSVSVYGQDFKPDSVTNGQSFASQPALDKFFQSLQPTMQMNNLMGQIDQMKNWQYNPQTDPSFQQAQQGITRNVMNTMQDRGLLNSTLTSQGIAQATAAALPQFETQAFNRNQQNLSNLFNIVQQLQAQKQAEADAKRSQENSALNTLNSLAGITGKVPDIGAQFGLKPGEATASEKARLAAQAAANAPQQVPLRTQLIDGILSGALDPNKLTPAQQKILGVETAPPKDEASAYQSELRQLLNVKMNIGYDSLAPTDQKWVDDRINYLRSAVRGGSATPAASTADPYMQKLQASILDGQVSSYADVEQMVNEMRDQIVANGGNPDALLQYAAQQFGK